MNNQTVCLFQSQQIIVPLPDYFFFSTYIFAFRAYNSVHCHSLAWNLWSLWHTSNFLDFINYLSFLCLAVGVGSFVLFQTRTRCWSLNTCSNISHVTHWPPSLQWKIVTMEEPQGWFLPQLITSLQQQKQGRLWAPLAHRQHSRIWPAFCVPLVFLLNTKHLSLSWLGTVEARIY